jgi:very-short-patch-repair endonuclease
LRKTGEIQLRKTGEIKFAIYKFPVNAFAAANKAPVVLLRSRFLPPALWRGEYLGFECHPDFRNARQPASSGVGGCGGVRRNPGFFLNLYFYIKKCFDMARLNNSREKTMFYGAKPYLFERARKMRLHQTEAEAKLWELLQNKKMMGLRFKRQQPISMFIADFYCHKLKLVIEVDGEIHHKQDQKVYDVNRTAEMERLGIVVIRFTNNQVHENLEDVKGIIESKCRELNPPAS